MSIGLIYKDTAPVYREVTRGGVPYLISEKLEETGVVRHGFSTRLGGVSTGVFSTMNLSYSRGDDGKAVLENYRRMGNAIGVLPERMVCTWQTHSANIRRVTEADAGKGVVISRDYREVDGLITDVPGLCLVTFYADCVPILFVDPIRGVIAAIHSGWRGMVAGIGTRAVGMMVQEYGCRPERIVAAIGPSVCQDCYEVGEDTIREIRGAFDERHWDSLFYRKENGKYQLNLWRANEIQLLAAGILPEHLSVNNLCTRCNRRLLFSHRAVGDLRGNMAAFLALKEE